MVDFAWCIGISAGIVLIPYGYDRLYWWYRMRSNTPTKGVLCLKKGEGIRITLGDK